MIKIKGKDGQILVENVIFIVLNLIFLSILILFLYSKVDSASVLEEKYSKQIALMIDSAEPGMRIHLNMEDAIKEAENNGWDVNKMVSISGNSVIVKLREKGENSYEFFNDVDVSVFPDTSLELIKDYIISING